jgi:hypothetical protein
MSTPTQTEARASTLHISLNVSSRPQIDELTEALLNVRELAFIGGIYGKDTSTPSKFIAMVHRAEGLTRRCRFERVELGSLHLILTDAEQLFGGVVAAYVAYLGILKQRLEVRKLKGDIAKVPYELTKIQLEIQKLDLEVEEKLYLVREARIQMEMQLSDALYPSKRSLIPEGQELQRSLMRVKKAIRGATKALALARDVHQEEH